MSAMCRNLAVQLPKTMKHLTHMTNSYQKWLTRLWSILMTITIGIMLIGFTGCSSNEPTPDAKTKLYATWMVGNGGFLKRDGVIMNSEYPNLEVTFQADGTYSSKNAGLIFKPSGVFSWKDEEANGFTRDQEISTDVQFLANGSLVMTFQLQTQQLKGRQNATIGNWEISLQLKK